MGENYKTLLPIACLGGRAKTTWTCSWVAGTGTKGGSEKREEEWRGGEEGKMEGRKNNEDK